MSIPQPLSPDVRELTAMVAPDGWTRWPPQHPAITQSITETLQTHAWGQYHSPIIATLQRQIEVEFNAPAARLTCSGTVAIELAVRLCLPPRAASPPRFLVAAYDYPGVLRTVELAGGRPVLVDCFTDRPVIDAQSLRQCDGSDVVAVIASDLHGHQFDHQSVAAVCRDRGWRLIHDVCQSPVSTRVSGDSQPPPADFRTLSFGGSKPITGGSGGALLFGSARDAVRCNAIVDRPSDTYAMSPLAAAAVSPQLAWLDELNQRRRDTAAQLDGLPWDRLGCHPLPPAPADASHYKYPLLANRAADRTNILQTLTEAGIPAGKGFRSASKVSARRADRIGSLINSSTWSERLILLDGRVLLTNQAAARIAKTCMS